MHTSCLRLLLLHKLHSPLNFYETPLVLRSARTLILSAALSKSLPIYIRRKSLFFTLSLGFAYEKFYFSSYFVAKSFTFLQVLVHYILSQILIPSPQPLGYLSTRIALTQILVPLGLVLSLSLSRTYSLTSYKPTR